MVIKNKFITMHGIMNVKLVSCLLLSFVTESSVKIVRWQMLSTPMKKT